MISDIARATNISIAYLPCSMTQVRLLLSRDLSDHKLIHLAVVRNVNQQPRMKTVWLPGTDVRSLSLTPAVNVVKRLWFG